MLTYFLEDSSIFFIVVLELSRVTRVMSQIIGLRKIADSQKGVREEKRLETSAVVYHSCVTDGMEVSCLLLK